MGGKAKDPLSKNAVGLLVFSCKCSSSIGLALPRPFLFVQFYVLVVVGFLLWFPHVDVVVLVLVVPVVALGLRRRSEAQLKRTMCTYVSVYV